MPVDTMQAAPQVEHAGADRANVAVTALGFVAILGALQMAERFLVVPDSATQRTVVHHGRHEE